MSYHSIDVKDFPNEILLKIFRHLDSTNLVVVANVCQKWRGIVKMIHDTAWKSVTKAVLLKRDIIRPLYESRGWIEAEHGMNNCNCIKVAMELVTYNDLQLLNSDLKLLESKSKLNGGKLHELNVLTFPEIEEIEAYSRLSAAGVLTHIKEVIILDIDFSSIKYIGHFISNVKDRLELIAGALEPDLSIIFPSINCRELEINSRWDPLTDAEIKGLNEILNSRVEKFSLNHFREPFLPYIEQYDGRGKCQEIDLEYAVHEDEEDPESLWNRDKIIDWSESRGWTFSVDDFYFNIHSINVRRN